MFHSVEVFRRVTGVVTLAGVLACGGSTEPKEEDAVASVQANQHVTLPPGEVTLSWSCTNSISANASWKSGTIPVTGTEVVQVTRAGVHQFIVTCHGMSGEVVSAEVSITASRLFVLNGQVMGITGNFGKPRVYVRRGHEIDSLDVDPTGNGTFAFTTKFVDDGGCFTVTVDETAPSNRAFFPLEFEGCGQELLNFRRIRVPMVESCTGQDVALSLEKAGTLTTDALGKNPSSYLNHRVLDEGNYYLTATWPGPAPIAFDPGLGSKPYTAEMEASFWDHMDELNDEACRPLVRRVPLSELNIRPGESWNYNGELWEGIRVGSENANLGAVLWLTNQLTAYQGISLLFNLGGSSDKHEVLHALNIGHTLAWESVMHPAMSPDHLSVEDASYLELLYKVRERELQTGARCSIADSHQGERVRILGLAKEKVANRCVAYSLN